jgi:Stress responsive A/B Barrel Domain
MYKHIVFWKIKKQKTEADGMKLIKEIKRRLDTLPAVIPEIISYETAINIGDYGASFFDISLISEFQNKETFWKYTKYPEHDELVAFIQSVQEDEQIVDYEI